MLTSSKMLKERHGLREKKKNTGSFAAGGSADFDDDGEEVNLHVDRFSGVGQGEVHVVFLALRHCLSREVRESGTEPFRVSGSFV